MITDAIVSMTRKTDQRLAPRASTFGLRIRRAAAGPRGRRAGVRIVWLCMMLLSWSTLSPSGAQPRPLPGAAVTTPESAGYPPFQNYTPDDYGRNVQSQNWSVTQDDEGLIYVANPNGVLVYDGVEWRQVSTERETFVRTVVTDTSGTVYVGAYGEIGMLQPDSTGVLQYVSLLDEIDPRLHDFGHTWSGAAVSSGVFFQTQRLIFHWDGQSMRHWRSSDSTGFTRVFSVRDSIYVHERGVGLKKYVSGGFQQIAGSNQFANELVRTVLPLNSGLLVGTESGDLYQYQGQEFTLFEAESEPYLAEHELYDGVELRSGAFALATLRGGVLMMDRTGQTLQVLDKRTGLVDNDIKSLFVDRQGGLWLASGGGLSRVDVLSPLSFYDERIGLEGDAYAIERYNGDVYAGTSAGVYRLGSTSGPGSTTEARFQLVPGLRAQVFDLKATSSGLLVASDKGVYAIEPDRMRRVGSGRTAFGLHVSRYDSTVAYVGYIDGVGTLRRTDDEWIQGASLGGFNREVHYLNEDESGALWVASAFGGLWRVDVANGLQGAPLVQPVAEEANMPQHTFRMAFADEGLRVLTRSGVARPVVNETGRVSLQADSTFHQVLPADHAPIQAVEVGPDSNVWILTSETVYWVRQEAEDGYSVSTPVRQISEFETLDALSEPDGVFWLAGERGVVRHVPRRTRMPTPSIRTLIRRVATVATDSMIYGGNARQDIIASNRETRAVLTYDHNALRFQFAAPAYGSNDRVEYQHRLIGFTDEWSLWTDEARKDYTNLAPGNYEFQVQARSPRTWEASTATFHFEILSPWYRTTWAYALFGVLGVTFIAGAVWWRSAHLEARASELERMVAQRTEEVQDQAKQLASYNRELRQTNEVLQETLEQKSELLGIAAHDLKNPLFGIRGLSEILLEKKELDESSQRKLKLIYESADETLELINDLLESAAASSGQVRLDMELVDIEPVAEWVVHSFRQQAEKKGQHIHFTTSEEDCRVKADERKLREAMSNLVSNAVKYSPKGSDIEVDVRRVGDQISFRVSDEGPGLSEEERKNLFSPFQRLSPEPTAGEASSGLGLYIVKQLVDLHDGEVWVESEVDEGSTFGITLSAAWTTSGEQQTARMSS